MFYTKLRVRAFIGGFMFGKNFISSLVLLWAFVLVPCGLKAQENDTLHYALEEVVALSASGVAPASAAVPFQRIDANDIRRLALQDLSDVVKRMSGVQVQDYGGIGGLKTVSVRGLGAKHTAVCYDGVVVSDAQSGMIDLGRFSLENVSAVSLTMGQGDNLTLSTAREYALATQLSMTTARIDSGFNSSMKLETGSFGLAGLSGYSGYGSKNGVFAVSLGGNYLRSDGMYPFTLVNGALSSQEKRRDSDTESLTLEGNVKLCLPVGRLAAKVYYYNSERGLPGAVNLYNKDNKERLWNRNFFAQAVYDFELPRDVDMRVVAKYDRNFTRYREINKNYAAGEQVDENRQSEYYLSLVAAVPSSVVRRLSYSVASDISYSTLDNNFENSASPRRLSSYTVLSARYGNNNAKIIASLLATCIKDDVSAGGVAGPYKRLSPALSLSLGNVFCFRASFKDSYRVPTFADLYYQRQGNTTLRPERATQYNVGLTWQDFISGPVECMASVTVDAYYNNVRDKIVALPTMYIWRMMNFGKVDVYGVDANVSVGVVRLSKDMSLMFDANYSWQRAVDVTDSSAKNYRHQIPYTPEHSGGLSLTLENPIVDISYMLTAVGERFMLPQNNVRNRMPGYVEHSFSLNRNFAIKGATLHLQGKLLNVGNEGYEVIRYYPMPGFSWRLSARISF